MAKEKLTAVSIFLLAVFSSLSWWFSVDPAVAQQTPVSVEFRNNTSDQIDVFWENFQGQQVPYGSIAPGSSIVQQSYAGHVWILEQGGQILRKYSVGNQGAQVVDLEVDTPERRSSDIPPGAVQVRFQNDTGGPVEVFYKAPDGSTQPYAQIQPGQSFDQLSYPTQTWLIVQRGQILREYVVASEQVQVATAIGNIQTQPQRQANKVVVGNFTDYLVNAYQYADKTNTSPIASIPPDSKVELDSYPGIVWSFAIGSQIVESMVTQDRERNIVAITDADLAIPLRTTGPEQQNGTQVTGQDRDLDNFNDAPTDPTEVVLVVENGTCRGLDLYWENFQGEPVKYGSIANGDTFRQQTVTGHRWVLVDGSDIWSEFEITRPSDGGSEFLMTLYPDPAKECEEAGLADEPASNETAYIYVENNTCQAVDVYFDTGNDQPIFFLSIDPGKSKRNYTNLGNQWIVAQGDQILERVSVDSIREYEIVLPANGPCSGVGQTASDQTNQPTNLDQECLSLVDYQQLGVDARLSKPQMNINERSRNVGLMSLTYSSVKQTAGVSRKYLMPEDLSCAINFDFEQINVSGKTITKVFGTTTTSSLYNLSFTPEARAWKDPTSGKIYLSVDVRNNMALNFLHTNKNAYSFKDVSGLFAPNSSAVAYNAALPQSFSYGPFLEEKRVTFFTPTGFDTEEWYPKNKMHISSVSQSRSTSTSENLGVSPMVMFSQLGAGASQSNDTSLSSQLGSYEILHSRNSSRNDWTYHLCTAGEVRANSNNNSAVAACTYQRPSDLFITDSPLGGGAINYQMGTREVPSEAFQFEVGGAAAVYEMKSGANVNSPVTVKMEVELNMLTMSGKQPKIKFMKSPYDMSSGTLSQKLDFELVFDISQLLD